MQISYQYADTSNTSILLRIKDQVNNETACILIDSGDGVDVDELLEEDEYLTGIILTHLHVDHYISLNENLQDGAEIFTSTTNADLLPQVFEDANRYLGEKADIGKLKRSVTPIEDELTIFGDISIKTVPAGHTPGAAAFYLTLTSSAGKEQTILITGDFTRRSVAGYSGLPLADVDCIIFTGASNESFSKNLTEATDTALQHAVSGSPTIVSATGFEGLHFAYVVGHAIEEMGKSVGVSIVGQAAELYNALGYDVPNVTAITEYRASNVINQNEITISGPREPTMGASKKFLDIIRYDPKASLIQLSSNDVDIGEYNCTVNRYDCQNHPSREAIKEYIELVDPKIVIATHQTGSDLKAHAGEYECVVWAPRHDKDQHVVYKEGKWKAPRWMNQRLAHAYLTKTTNVNSISLPDAKGSSFERQEPDLEKEGLNLDEITGYAPAVDQDVDTKYTTSVYPSEEMSSETETGPEVEVEVNSEEPVEVGPDRPTEDSIPVETRTEVGKIGVGKETAESLNRPNGSSEDNHERSVPREAPTETTGVTEGTDQQRSESGRSDTPSMREELQEIKAEVRDLKEKVEDEGLETARVVYTDEDTILLKVDEDVSNGLEVNDTVDMMSVPKAD